MDTKSDAWPAGCVLPDYGPGGIYGLASALRTWLHDTDAGLDVARVAPGEAATVVLLVIDGLGAHALDSFGRGSALAADWHVTLTSVFPSTTASAVTTLMTGASPAEHGLNGWFIHDRRFGGVIAPLPLEARGDGPLHALRLTSRLFTQRSMFRDARRPAFMVSPQQIAFFTLFASPRARCLCPRLRHARAPTGRDPRCRRRGRAAGRLRPCVLPPFRCDQPCLRLPLAARDRVFP
ncbi:alkaline phosphatase family protein [Thauera humireducens]|uniref:alkaline phosphatase family protein n=1 Tax=Thauera humireducens TaxID=1134435 RepID=UPI00311FBD59